MADQLLETRLAALGAHLVYPPTPALAGAVRARIAALPDVERRPRVAWWRRRPVVSAAAALAALAILIGAVPPVRTTVAHWLGIRGIVIEPVPTNPTPTPRASTTPTPSLGERLLLGRQATLAQAQAAVDFPIAIPANVGAPDAVYLREQSGFTIVTLLYYPRASLPEAPSTGVGMLVTEFRATVEGTILKKIVGPDATVEPVTVAGAAGYFISGAPHEVAYSDGHGSFINDQLRLAGNTLIFERGGISVRVEANVTRDQAIAIAMSLH